MAGQGRRFTISRGNKKKKGKPKLFPREGKKSQFCNAGPPLDF